LSMKNGDAFAKRFGGESGGDPDFFKITIRKWLNGEQGQDSVDFYLADYRFEDNSLDYIVQEWSYVNLESLGGVDSLEFSLSSSDVGAFGMNTPAFFCIDDIRVGMISSNNEIDKANIDLKITPNPATHFISIDPKYESVLIYNTSGQLIHREEKELNRIDISHLKNGLYYIKTRNGSSQSFLKF